MGLMKLQQLITHSLSLKNDLPRHLILTIISIIKNIVNATSSGKRICWNRRKDNRNITTVFRRIHIAIFLLFRKNLLTPEIVEGLGSGFVTIYGDFENFLELNILPYFRCSDSLTTIRELIKETVNS